MVAGTSTQHRKRRRQKRKMRMRRRFYLINKKRRERNFFARYTKKKKFAFVGFKISMRKANQNVCELLLCCSVYLSAECVSIFSRSNISFLPYQNHIVFCLLTLTHSLSFVFVSTSSGHTRSTKNTQEEEDFIISFPLYFTDFLWD